MIRRREKQKKWGKSCIWRKDKTKKEKIRMTRRRKEGGKKRRKKE